LEEENKPVDEAQLAKIEEYARLQIELDRRFGSWGLAQMFTLIVTFVIPVLFLGFLSEILLYGSHSVSSFASVLAFPAVIGMSDGIRSSNIRKFLR
jgi:hypothetical protein